MVEQIRKVLPALQAGDAAAEIPGMGGYFVTILGADIPENARRVVELGIDEGKYLVYGLLVPEKREG